MTDDVGAAEQSAAPAAQLPAELSKALVAAWAELGNLTKGKTANAGTYSYAYSDLGDLLEMARPVLAKHGLALIQPITRNGGGSIVIDTCVLHTSGQRMSWLFEVQATGSPQQIGSAITYGRRYSAQAALGVASEDDDGQAAAKAAPIAAPQRVTSGPTPEQTKRAMALFDELDLGHREDRLRVTSEVLGREVGSWVDVTQREAGKVIDALVKAASVQLADDVGQEVS
jgi:hypothetical protein